jgi:site-specific DNA-methyltransferase (cytosine-N4-specific)
MKTLHQIFFKNAQNMNELSTGSVNLVVTSPPYPMIEMWDEMFSLLNTEIGHALKCGDGLQAYLLMNQELEKVWRELDRVLAPSGMVCINIGDATRKIGDRFQLYPNHSYLTQSFQKRGFNVLPPIIWRKPSNKPTKFMGSGMLPPNAYVTLEHEYILIFRKDGPREVSREDMQKRRESSYFWEERNQWFSDVWQDLQGTPHDFQSTKLRNRTAAFPFELAYRLINMYSVQGDRVLDPFLGTGTSTLAASCSARNSAGYELDPNFRKVIKERVQEVPGLSEKITSQRLEAHEDFLQKRAKNGQSWKYESSLYKFGVITRTEEDIHFPIAVKVKKTGENRYEVSYDPEYF